MKKLVFVFMLLSSSAWAQELPNPADRQLNDDWGALITALNHVHDDMVAKIGATATLQKEVAALQKQLKEVGNKPAPTEPPSTK